MRNPDKCPRCKTPVSPRELTSIYYERESDGEQVQDRICPPCVTEVRSGWTPIYTMVS
jgi:hypothetical protein